MVPTNQNQSFDTLMPPYGYHRLDCYYNRIAHRVVPRLLRLEDPELIRRWLMKLYPKFVRTEDEAHRVLIVAWGPADTTHLVHDDPADGCSHPYEFWEEPGPNLEKELRRQEDARLLAYQAMMRQCWLWNTLHDGSVWKCDRPLTMLPRGTWGPVYYPVVVSWGWWIETRFDSK